ncbi:hypothetical protein Afe04nite_38820 [Asanoa ferruginea]|nr:hypothetical protein Afe04nite_38820 [Asanoa ferruginea]
MWVQDDQAAMHATAPVLTLLTIRVGSIVRLLHGGERCRELSGLRADVRGWPPGHLIRTARCARGPREGNDREVRGQPRGLIHRLVVVVQIGLRPFDVRARGLDAPPVGTVRIWVASSVGRGLSDLLCAGQACVGFGTQRPSASERLLGPVGSVCSRVPVGSGSRIAEYGGVVPSHRWQRGSGD